MSRRPGMSRFTKALWYLVAFLAVATCAASKVVPDGTPDPAAAARSQSNPAHRARRERPVPPRADARAVARLAEQGASPRRQRAALERYLVGRRISSRAIAAIMRRTETGIVLVRGPGTAMTRIGGRPVVPRGQSWPKTPKGNPLTYIGAVDFSELPALDPLPRGGTLAIYYNLYYWEDDEGGGGFGDEAAKARLYYIPPGAPVSHPRATESSYPVDPPSPLRGRVVSIAGEPSSVIDELGQSRELDRVLKTMNELTRTGIYGDHHVLGRTLEIQSAPIEGLPTLFDPKRHLISDASRARYTPAERDPRRWRLLVQVNEDDGLGIADGGALYFLILDSDLRARRFDRVIAVLDSH